jgi:hypothetical protein
MSNLASALMHKALLHDVSSASVPVRKWFHRIPSIAFPLMPLLEESRLHIRAATM